MTDRWSRIRDGAIVVVLALVTHAAASARASAQTTVAVEPDRNRAASADVEQLLRRPISIDLDRVLLPHALDSIAAVGGVEVQYRSAVVNARTVPVTLHAVKMPLGMAFEQALRGTRLHLVPLKGARFGLAEGEENADSVTAGTVTGVVIDQKTRKPVPNATVSLDQAARGIRVADDGTFRIAGVAPGVHAVAVRAIGYTRATQTVTVVDGQSARVSVLLAAATNVLDQIVVTATGEQRYRELGHVVAKLNADSLVKNAPITSVAELLTARVPGLQVVTTNGGMAGGEVALRLRGQTTSYLDPQPIVIVDGVRYKNTNAIVSGVTGGAAVGEDMRPFNAEQRSPLNDLNVNDIETVEVVKGPSASTLYGPDAANGVIVITTKRAKAGKTEWHVYAHPHLNDISGGGLGEVPQRGYWAWGHDPSTGQTVNYSCTLVNTYYQQCVQDSITFAPLALASPDYNVITQNRPQWQYGADVGGGSDALRYFLSAGYDSQTGSLHIPDAAAQVLKEQLGVAGLSDAIRNPNTQQTATAHSSLTATPSSRLTTTVTAMYSQTTQRSLDANVYGFMAAQGVLMPGCSPTDPNNPCKTSDALGTSFFLQTTQQDVQRFTGSANAVAQVTPWLTANATLGLDLDGTIDRGVRPANSLYDGDGGEVSDHRRNNSGRTATLGGTANAHPGRFSFRSSLGAQYNYVHLDGLDTDGQNLAPGSTSISTATYQYISQLWSETVTLGTYGEEVVGLNDRLFLTGALRFDGSTSFGDAYHPRPYPKVGLSWIASDEPRFPRIPGLSELRFRYSFGAASRYPTSAMKLGSISSYQSVVDYQTQNLYTRSQLGNPLLRPERTREAEYGADATLLGGRVTAGLTWYNRRTIDQLQGALNPQGLPQQWVNVGTVQAHGFEGTLEARLFETRTTQATIHASYSRYADKLLSLGDVPNGGLCTGCFAVGYPLSSNFQRRIIGVADTVGGGPDGIIIGSQEIVRDSLPQFMGVLYPPTTVAVTPALSLWSGWVRLSTAFDRQTGFVILDNAANSPGLGLAALKPGSSLLDQAKYVLGYTWYEPGDFTRWRELTLSTNLPRRLLRMVFMSRGTVNFQVRNLALWTRYRGADPESQPGTGITGTSFAQTSALGIPLARSWNISFDVTP